jgi:hypothetical protein
MWVMTLVGTDGNELTGTRIMVDGTETELGADTIMLDGMVTVDGNWV